jgi:non-canonical poly(A) RNA polymerase PAPD5/7
LDFARYIQPSEAERAVRTRCYEFLKATFESAIPGTFANKFGSFASGLNLKNADIDLVLVHPTHPSKKLMGLAFTEIEARPDLLGSVEVVKSAKVPLIKFKMIQENCEIDMCFNETGGVEDLRLVGEAIISHPEIKPIYLTMKLFFRQRRLNNAYHGGIGSFLLFLLVNHFVVSAKEKKGPATGQVGVEGTLGYYLMGFLEHYSFIFNFRNDKIDFNSVQREQKKQDSSVGLVVIPLGKTENIAQSCYRFLDITRILKNRYLLLQELVMLPGESILQHLLNPKGVDFSRYEEH